MYEEILTQQNLTFVESILEICSIELAEAGDYTCNASNDFMSEANTTSLSVIDNRGMSVCVWAT